MMRSSCAWAGLVSHFSSMMHVLVAVLAGYLISSSVTARSIINPLVFVFVGTSKLFMTAFTEDGNTSKKTRTYLAIALASLLPLLTGLAPFELTMGVLILMLYALYPFVDGKAPFDAVHHVLRYVLIFVLGYGSLTLLNRTASLAILTIVLFSLAGELLVGLRKKCSVSKESVSSSEIKRSMILVISSIFIASLMSAFLVNDLFEFPLQINGMFVPFYIVPALAIDLFLMMPFVNVLNGRFLDPFRSMRGRELVVILIVSLSILILFQTGRTDTEVQVNSRNYSFDVGIRTFIAGQNSWDVPWIIFDYVNEDNYYYIVFHKDGVLELSQKTNGQIRYYESSLETQLSPFEHHDFHILLNETSVMVRLDDEYQVAAARQAISSPTCIMISHPTGFWIACIHSININQ